MRKKVIFLDIDGTLTEPGCNEPPASAIEAIQKARANGHYVFLCSGRSYAMLKQLLKYGFDGVIASAGGDIRIGERVIYDCPMEMELAKEALAVLRKNGVYCTIECTSGSYKDMGFDTFLAEHAGEGANSEMLRWRRQMERELYQKGISRADFQKASEEMEAPDEEQQVRQWIVKKRFDAETADRQERDRLIRFLLRRGYGMAVIQRVLRGSEEIE